MKKVELSRRTFLRGAGGVSVGLPLMASGLGAIAQDSAGGGPPKRFVVVFIPNGVLPGAWFPSSVNSERDFTFGQTMAPLAAHRDRLIAFRGLSTHSRQGPGDPHQNGMGAVLTGRPLLEGDFAGGGCDCSAGWASGISLDQRIANHIGTDTRFSSLELGVYGLMGGLGGTVSVRTRLSYSGAAAPLHPIDDPRESWDRLFSDFDTDTGELDRIRRRRASVLDTVLAQHNAVRGRLSTADRDRLDQHAEVVRTMERRLDNLAVGTACAPPDRPPEIGRNYDNIPQMSRHQIDVMVSALACDVTRVASLMYCNSNGNYAMPFSPVDSTAGGHELGHSSNDSNAEGAEFNRRVAWTMGELAYLLDSLEAISEGEGTMLDNTLVFVVSENSTPHHKKDDMPFVLAGNVGGYFDTGRYLQYDDHSHNDLLVSIQNAYGIADDRFGAERWCDGPLAGLRA